jgi:glyoxylase-like metal-dependent hydrolase (beta-lactamase superfamily II)
MIHEVLPVGQLGCNCSILGDPDTAEAIVIDPGDDISEIEAILSKHGLMVKMILITHAHIDHIGGAAKLKASTGAPVYMNENDADLYKHIDVQASWLGMAVPEKTAIDGSLKDGDKFLLGTTELLAMHTPGHTLFRDSIGRTDLPGGDGRQILRSISNKLLPLPEDTTVICGHGDATTIGREKKRNPFLRGL